MEEVFQQIGRLVYEADQHGLWTNTGIRIQLGWSPFAIYGVHATDDRGAIIGAGANPLTDKAIEIRQLLKSLDASPPEKHKCCGKPYLPYPHTTCKHYAEVLARYRHITSHQENQG